jgi:hypothetical protein
MHATCPAHFFPLYFLAGEKRNAQNQVQKIVVEQ